MGGRIIHMISHTHLQKGGAKGKYASALILTNILDEKISLKMGLAKSPSQRYVSDWETPQGQSEQPYIQPTAQTQQSNYLTPSSDGGGLTGTSQITEVDANDPSFSYASICIYCGYDFTENTGKIYMCQGCKAPYHESCINMQINEGICKNCSRILLW